jgi:peptidoglycan/LPS O-acetylase OafA/YrhL
MKRCVPNGRAARLLPVFAVVGLGLFAVMGKPPEPWANAFAFFSGFCTSLGAVAAIVAFSRNRNQTSCTTPGDHLR